MNIHEQIKEARLNAGLSQKELSELTGIRQSNISMLESGKYEPSLSVLRLIAEVTRSRFFI